MTHTELRGNNSIHIQGRIMVIVHWPSSHSHKSINLSCFMSIPFVLAKIWPGHISIMTNTILRGDNWINILGMIIVPRFYPTSHCHLSISQVLFQSLLYFPRYGRTGNKYEKWLRGDNTVNKQGRIMVLGFCSSPHCHISIYQVLFQWFQ